MITVFFIGRQNDPVLLAAVGLGNMMINVLAFAITQGLNGALEYYVSVSFGKKKYKECGQWLNRGKFVSTLALVPTVILYLNAEYLLLALKQDPAISKIAAKYLIIVIPGVWSQVMFDATKKFHSAQFITHLQLVAQAIMLVGHIFWCYLLIFKWGMGYTGAAIALDITYCGNMILIDAFSAFHEQLKKTWVLIPDKSITTELMEYLRLGLPAALMLCFEWWLFEILAILAGLMNVESLAAEVIIVTMVSYLFMVPLGCSFAASAFTGYFCANGQPDVGKKYTRLTVLFGLVLTSLQLLLLFLYQDSISRLFTTDEKVVNIVYESLTVLYIYIFFDTIHGINSGTIRGLGRTLQGSMMTFSCYWVLGLSGAVYLGFKKNQGVPGMWHAFAYACVLYVFMQLIVIEYKPWPNLQKDKSQAMTPPMTPEDRHFRRAVKENEIRKGNTPVMQRKVHSSIQNEDFEI